VNELSDRVYTLVGEYHGSITGEHNDGLIRTPYLHKMFDSEMLSVFQEIKEIFDPHRIFNPHKKVDPKIEYLHTAIKKHS
jgi:FAD/FMN-containing dehydrogenase